MKNSLFTSAILLSGLLLVGCADTETSTDTMTMPPAAEVTEEIMIDTTTPETEEMETEEEMDMDDEMGEEEMDEESMDDMTTETTVTTEVEVLE